MKQSCIMRQCIAVSAQEAQVGLLQGSGPFCSQLASLACPCPALEELSVG